MVALRVSDIAKAFGGVVALDGVSFTVGRGEIVGLIGPNGSGKTTLLNVISGVYNPDRGIVSLNGRDLTTLKPHQIVSEGIARTFQHVRLFENLTSLENVQLGTAISAARVRSSNGSSRRDALVTMTELGLGAQALKLPNALPYGVQRRVEMARAVATDPDFMLLDEPAAGMNETESDELMDSLRSLRDRHQLGLVVIDHDLRLIMRLCDRIVVLNSGAVIAEGSPDYVANHPEVIRAYIGDMAADSFETEGQRRTEGNGNNQEEKHA